jgi:hypothetical protein
VADCRNDITDRNVGGFGGARRFPDFLLELAHVKIRSF